MEAWQEMKAILRNQAELRGEDMEAWDRQWEQWEESLDKAIETHWQEELSRRMGQGQDALQAQEDMQLEAAAGEEKSRQTYEATKQFLADFSKGMEEFLAIEKSQYEEIARQIQESENHPETARDDLLTWDALWARMRAQQASLNQLELEAFSGRPSHEAEQAPSELNQQDPG